MSDELIALFERLLRVSEELARYAADLETENKQLRDEADGRGIEG